MNVYADPDLIKEIMPHLQSAYKSIAAAREIMEKREIALIGKNKSDLADHNVNPIPEWVKEENRRHNFDGEKFQNMIIEAKLAGGKYRVLLDKLLEASDAIIEVAEQDENGSDELTLDVMEIDIGNRGES